MSISELQQLETFAYWRRRVMATRQGKSLWGLSAAIEERLMNQAPLYALNGARVDLFAEATLKGAAQVDLSAQYAAELFAKSNPLRGRSVEQEGEFFRYYAGELEKLRPSLLKACALYLEADIGEEAKEHVASFINLAGDIAEELLPTILAYKGWLDRREQVTAILKNLKPWCEPWHFGFMESRREKPLRLVLILKNDLQTIEEILHLTGISPLAQGGVRLLQNIAELDIFSYMLDLDIMPDGSVGSTVGIELLPKNAIWPTRQQRLLATSEYKSFCDLLQQAELADERLEALMNVTFTAKNADVYIYSRISHFKLRWQGQKALPAKVYVQLRGEKVQSCLNEALGYVKVLDNEREKEHEWSKKKL